MRTAYLGEASGSCRRPHSRLCMLAAGRLHPPPPHPQPNPMQVLYTTHDWALVFEVAAGLYAVGALAYLQFASCEEQFAAEGSGPAAAAVGAAVRCDSAAVAAARPKAQ